ncbi:D-Ala-D-Ala carboxypeptidase family metallohydrolase [Acidovorax sp. NCPPB 4044]|uniref:D-Ala-D-Ala carboxypeptidase family metallohydrolase n=1 Tax=Acidovorax sp. NCPPB 4044 TaxID=2940490 RepID=UPI002304C6BC|nr:D-Ala-D-Ala carboxypeptidase family metallohydrolase [Acidovorax sp. NCPPB 4044]MDA8522297.1 D-Ala-D-Ala carboxypeptidase family metallohydrolase [Acidovorax sp. NCPPB 4044]
MQLTTHFTLEELTASTTAARLGLDNTPPAETVVRLQQLADMLQRIREHLCVPMIITSGYRAPAVNKAVGGVSTSDHQAGMAADFIAPSFGKPAQVARSLAPVVSVLGIGQLIYEHIGGKAWVHVSTRIPIKPSNRVITITGKGTQLGVQEGE